MWGGSPNKLPNYVSTRTYRTTKIEILREHVDLIENPNSVVLRKSQLLRGVAPSGKSWTRFNDISADMLVAKPNKAGVMRINFLRKARNKFMNLSPYTDQYDNFFGGAAYEAIEKFLERVVPERYRMLGAFGEDYAILFYPGLSFAEVEGVPSIFTSRLRVSLREENAMNMAVAAFGKRHYRKDLVKSLVNCENYHNIELAIALRGSMKTDWLVEILRSDRAMNFNAIDCGNAAALLSRLPENRRRRFALSFPEMHNYYNSDALRMGLRLTDEQLATVRNLTELHDLGVENAPWHERAWQQAQAQRAGNVEPYNPQAWQTIGHLAPAKPLEIKLNDRTKLYDGIETDDGLKIVAPKDSTTIQKWSDEMGNCIRSYAEDAAEGVTNLGAVFDGDKLVANFEIDAKGNLRQLLGRFNRHLDKSLQSDILDELEEVGAVNPASIRTAWGVDLLTALP